MDGYAQEYSCVDAQALTAIPDNYSFAQAATLPCAGLTAWRSLIVDGNLQAGDTVLVQGTGGMSIFALQIAKAAGAYVYATTCLGIGNVMISERADYKEISAVCDNLRCVV